MQVFFNILLLYFIIFIIGRSFSASISNNFSSSDNFIDSDDDFFATYDGDDDHENYEDDDFQMLISGGYRPQKHMFTKYVVSIRTSKPTAYFGDNHFCTGTIIASQIVLTAAHCVVDPNKVVTRPRRLVVVAGAPNRLKEAKTTIILAVDRIIPHTEFTRKGSHDIAIIRVKGQFPDDNDAIKIISMNYHYVKSGTNCTVLGWGQMFKNGPYSADAVYVNLTIYKREVCKKFYPHITDDSIYCAGDKLDWEKDACRGDSGSPLICGGKLVGISSWGMRCGEKEFPSVFASLRSHRKWISSINAAWRLGVRKEAILLYIIVVITITYL